MKTIYLVIFAVIIIVELFIFLWLDNSIKPLDEEYPCPECSRMQHHMNHMHIHDKNHYLKKFGESMMQGALRGSAVGLITGGIPGAVTTGTIMCFTNPFLTLIDSREDIKNDLRVVGV